MRVVMLVNPIAGRGRALQAVAEFRETFGSCGIAAEQFSDPAAAPGTLDGFDAALVIGGDGTLNRWLGSLASSGLPVWHVPFGTENLFARTFGHSRRPERFVAAMHAGERLRIDLGCCGERLFAIMLSLGPDADVVRAVAAARAGAITRLSYAGPILRQLFTPLHESSRVMIDDEHFISGRLGMVVVANLPSYAAWLNPAWHADPADGSLDIVRLGGEGPIGIGLRLLAGWSRDPDLIPDRSVASGRAIEVHCEQPVAVQVDGDHLDIDTWAGNRLRIETIPAALDVLLPSRN